MLLTILGWLGAMLVIVLAIAIWSVFAPYESLYKGQW